MFFALINYSKLNHYLIIILSSSQFHVSDGCSLEYSAVHQESLFCLLAFIGQTPLIMPCKMVLSVRDEPWPLVFYSNLGHTIESSGIHDCFCAR